MARVLVTLNDLEGHFPRSFPLCRPFQVCAVFYQISTDSASRGPSATAGLLVLSYFRLCHVLPLADCSTYQLLFIKALESSCFLLMIAAPWSAAV